MNQIKPHSLDQRLKQLYSRINYERQSRATPRSFKLNNMNELLGRLNNPHLKYPVIHVAGTKGKGSVTTMVGSILSSAGFRTGVYTSPHLETIHQRMGIDGKYISDDQLLSVLNDLFPLTAEMDAIAEKAEYRDLTFFEITTSAMFHHFAVQQVDKAVIEVGLGGRLDSTNVCNPEVCVITNISFDHTKQLGNTLEQIAFEKAGIIKPRIPVVSGAINPSAAKVIEDVAAENEAPLYVVDRDFSIENVNDDGIGAAFHVKGQIGNRTFEYQDIKLSVLGAHQATNAALSIAVTELLRDNGDAINEASLRKGLFDAALNGRTEVLSRSPMVIIDMAHNVASIAALVETIQQLPKWNERGTTRLIVAMSRDKDARGMLLQLVPHFDEIIFTKYQDNPRGKEPEELKEIATSLRDQRNVATKFSIAPTPEAAWQSVRSVSTENDICCITGSVFLVAELRSLVLGS